MYIAQEGRAACIKVGIAEHRLRRLSMLQCGNPRQLYLRAVFCGDRQACMDSERRIQKAFRYKRVRGEWLAVDLSEIITFAEGLSV
jgi:T5orf172 domain